MAPTMDASEGSRTPPRRANEVLATPIPERFAGISLTQYELTRTVSHLYPQYERDVLRRVDR